MKNEKDSVEQFYVAFHRRDYARMADCYHTDAIFSDPIYRNLNRFRVAKMWEMLLRRGKDLRVDYTVLRADEAAAEVRWTARYTFSQTGKPVVNEVHSRLALRDGLIYRQTDTFNFYRWARQALGVPGLLLGWTPLLRSAVRRKAMGALDAFVAKNPA